MNSETKPSALQLNVLFSLLVASILLLATTAASDQGGRSVGTPISNATIQSLTKEEQDWLREHPVIRVVQDPAWPPIEFADAQGEFTGMTGDYLNLIEQRLGIKFERVRNLSWQEAYARLKRWEIDMTTSVAVTPERTEFWAFTKPYMNIPIVIITHMDVTYIADMRELAGKKVAVVDGYAVNDWIPRDFPEIQLVRVKSAQEGLKSLQQGDVFAYVENMLVVGYYLAKLKMTNVKIAGETPYVNAQSMAVRKDWAVLAGILQKTLDSISVTERNEIYRKWLPIRYEHGFNYTLLWQALAVFTVILLMLVVWNRKLTGEIKSRKRAEEALRSSEEKFRHLFDQAADLITIIDLQGNFMDLNIKFEEESGWSRDEMLGRNVLTSGIVTEDSVRKVSFHLNQLIQGKEIPMFEVDGARKEGGIVPYELRATPIKKDGKTVAIQAILRNITERKRAIEVFETLRKQNLQILQSAGEGILGLDKEGKHSFANPSAAKMLGYTQDELIGVDSHSVWHHQKRDGTCYPENECTIYKSIQDGTIHTVNDELFWRKDGTSFPVEYTSTPIEENEKIVGAVVTFRDITERKQMEVEIQKRIKDLEDFYEMAVSRELKMIELKDKIKGLKRKLEKYEKIDD